MASYPTTISRVSKTSKKRIKIGGKSSSGTEDSTLTGPIGDRERVGPDLVPGDIDRLVQIHKHQDPEENLVDFPVDEVPEHDNMVTKVEGLPVIKQACIDRGSTVDEVVHDFNDSPGAHVGRAVGLISELVVIILQFLVKDDQDDPIII